MTGLRVIIACLAAMLAAAPLAVAGPPAEAAGTFELTYGACTSNGMFGPTTSAQLAPKKPEGLTAEPKYKAKPLYGSVTLGSSGQGKPFLVAMDKSTPAGKTYDVLYVDRDRDGDLSEEKAVTVGRGGGQFALAVTVNGKQINRLFTASSHAMSESAILLRLRERGAWQGEARVGGSTLHIILTDGNGNGAYNDPFRLPEDGKSPGGAPDMFLTKPMTGLLPDFGTIGICPAMLEAGGRLYNATVAADGSSIAFAPFTGKTATLTAPDGLSAVLAVGGRILTVTARDGKLLVPAGKIRPFIYAHRKKDAAGKEWMLTNQPNFGAKAIDLPAGGSAAFPAGLPVQVNVKADATGKIAAGGTVKFTTTLTDKGGGAIQLMPITDKGDPEEAPPAVIVIKQGGKVLARGKSGFG